MGRVMSTLPSSKPVLTVQSSSAAVRLHVAGLLIQRKTLRRHSIACKVAQRDLKKATGDLRSTSSEFANGSVDAQQFLEQVSSAREATSIFLLMNLQSG